MIVQKLLVLAFFSIFSIFCSQAQAKDVTRFGYTLPEPPQPQSDLFRQDFTELHRYQDQRTPEECARAGKQSDLSFENGFGPETGVLTAAEMKKAKILSKRVIAKAGAAIAYFKKHFQRPRPYLTDEALSPCIRKPSYGYHSYPSGHSTMGYAMALVLAKKFPYKKEIILKQGWQIGENRILGGVHHPSDVQAGRLLAAQVAKKMFVTETPQPK
jgi:acid phosphatase (class A)